MPVHAWLQDESNTTLKMLSRVTVQAGHVVRQFLTSLTRIAGRYADRLNTAFLHHHHQP